MKIKLDDGAKVSRAHEDDAGLDLYAREDKVVPAHGSAAFDTGVHIQLEPLHLFAWNGLQTLKTAAILKSKSGLSVKHNIISGGTVDMGYTGSIVVKLYNLGDTDYTVQAGDKISQLVIVPVLTPALEVVDELEETERADGGFGSTGR